MTTPPCWIHGSAGPTKFDGNIPLRFSSSLPVLRSIITPVHQSPSCFSILINSLTSKPRSPGSTDSNANKLT
ncbi:hypothetical protein DERP_003169 [Dermatophagoides pteronyssinus]|uniref:Uncharacterized protein n=1 Tax=Dermatophagoides pteronyssinus TaxID=6956 RepID=A0ABQ8JJ85_DERPT|nr:hypothetical protein DERP_003169 [Dermatophagoides pteronyssinus]